MSSEPAAQLLMRARAARRPVEIAVGEPAPAGDERLEFVRFCYRRRRVAWPSLYDEMAAVAARGAYRGLGFAELAERGVCFGLPNLPQLAALSEQVMLEEGGQADHGAAARESLSGSATTAAEPHAEGHLVGLAAGPARS